jgi:hypothetical protein
MAWAGSPGQPRHGSCRGRNGAGMKEGGGFLQKAGAEHSSPVSVRLGPVVLLRGRLVQFTGCKSPPLPSHLSFMDSVP